MSNRYVIQFVSSFFVHHLLTIPIVICMRWLVTPEIGRVREGIYKILLLLTKEARELPGVESWNRFRDLSRILTGMEACGKTLLEDRKILGHRENRVVVEWRGGRCGILGRAPSWAQHVHKNPICLMNKKGLK